MASRDVWRLQTAAQVLIDLVLVSLSALLAYTVRFAVTAVPIPGGAPPPFAPYLASVPAVAGVCVVSLAIVGLYRIRRSKVFVDDLVTLFLGLCLTGLILSSLMGLYRGFSYSRLVLVTFLVIAMVLVSLGHLCVRTVLAWLRRRGRAAERVLIVGEGEAAQMVIHRMRMFPGYGYHLVGVLSDQMETGSDFMGVPVLGATSELGRILDASMVHGVFVAESHAGQSRQLQLMTLCAERQVDCRVVPGLLEIVSTRVAADALDGIPLISVRRIALDGFNLVLKRAFDLVVGCLLLLIGAVPMALIAVLIRLTSKGPVLYRQERVGADGRPFACVKFRTMVADAEEGTGPVFASPDDQRCTKVGGWLRRFSLDELPQLYNVVRGDMSLVGPRPERPHFVQLFGSQVPRYLERHRVRPGLTGWAQANDLRGQTSVAERTIYDLYYIENWSLAFDVKILLTTIVSLFFHRHAY